MHVLVKARLKPHYELRTMIDRPFVGDPLPDTPLQKQKENAAEGRNAAEAEAAPELEQHMRTRETHAHL
jgi:hypothetical protein